MGRNQSHLPGHPIGPPQTLRIPLADPQTINVGLFPGTHPKGRHHSFILWYIIKDNPYFPLPRWLYITLPVLCGGSTEWESTDRLRQVLEVDDQMTAYTRSMTMSNNNQTRHKF
jgi:hypothetical protein